MKIIENKLTDIDLFESPDATTLRKAYYTDLITIMLNTPREKYDSVSMRHDFKIFDAIDETKKTKKPKEKKEEVISLEDTDFAYLKNMLTQRTFTWSFRHKDLIVFEDYITQLK